MTRVPIRLRAARPVDETELAVPADRDWRLVVLVPLMGVYTWGERNGLGGSEERCGSVKPGQHAKSALLRLLGPDNFRSARERGFILATSHPGWLHGEWRAMALWAARTFTDPDERRAWLGVYVALLDARDAPARAFSPFHWRLSERF